MQEPVESREEVLNKFLKIEADLFDVEVDSVPVWERIRFWVFREVVKEKLGLGEAHDNIESPALRYARAGWLWFRNIFYKNPYFAGEHDVLFFGHPRRKLQQDGKWWDIYCDPILDKSDFDFGYFEKSYNFQHFNPAKTENLRHLDFIQNTGTLLRKTGIVECTLPQDAELKLRDTEDQLQQHFGVQLDIVQRVEETLANRKSVKKFYKLLLARADPELVVVVVSYGKETVIEVCKELGIPTVELQHGVIHDSHLGYSYPGSRTKETFPDYLLVWGAFWKKDIEFPIPDERVISVGYPYLEQSIEHYKDVESRDQILFISQGTIGEQLSKFALEVHDHPDINHEVVYKLHPGEYARWKEEYPWLLDVDVEVVDSSEPPLYELFAESSVQIGVGSTAVFEGLCFDLETYVYDCSGSSVLDPLVDEGAADIISSVDELAGLLGTGEVTFDREYYFKSNATENTCQTLQRLSSERSS